MLVVTRFFAIFKRIETATIIDHILSKLRGSDDSFQHGIHASSEFNVDHAAGGDCEIKFVVIISKKISNDQELI